MTSLPLLCEFFVTLPFYCVTFGVLQLLWEYEGLQVEIRLCIARAGVLAHFASNTSQTCSKCMLHLDRDTLCLFRIFINHISRISRGLERVQFGDYRIASVLFADDVALLNLDLQNSPEGLSVEDEPAAMRTRTSKLEIIVVDQKMVGLSSPGRGKLLHQVEESLEVLYMTEAVMASYRWDTLILLHKNAL